MKILVVDDNRDAATSLSMLVDVLGHEQRVAFGGLEALALVDSFVPDVVLLDLGMPDIDGFETCRRLRQQPWGSRVTVIAVTGWGQAEHVRMTQAAGFDLHLTKPVADARLRDVLDALAPVRGEKR